MIMLLLDWWYSAPASLGQLEYSGAVPVVLLTQLLLDPLATGHHVRLLY